MEKPKNYHVGLYIGIICEIIIIFSGGSIFPDSFVELFNRGTWILFVIFTLVVPIPLGLIFDEVLFNSLLNPKYEENRRKYYAYIKTKHDEKVTKQNDFLEKNQIPNNAIELSYIDGKLPNCNEDIKNTKLLVWINNNNICFAGKDYKYNISRQNISIDNVISFIRQGDVYTETNVSGGGSSIGGAVVGGVIAGGTGAVIGSRKKIKTENKRIDERKTILEYKDKYTDKKCYMFFDSTAYEVLLKLIPQKEINFSNKENIIKSDNKINEEIAFNNIRELAKLKDEGILTEEEFQAKKKQLLNI